MTCFQSKASSPSIFSLTFIFSSPMENKTKELKSNDSFPYLEGLFHSQRLLFKFCRWYCWSSMCWTFSLVIDGRFSFGGMQYKANFHLLLFISTPKTHHSFVSQYSMPYWKLCSYWITKRCTSSSMEQTLKTNPHEISPSWRLHLNCRYIHEDFEPNEPMVYHMQSWDITECP